MIENKINLKNILIFKWGRATYCYTGGIHKKGKSGDLELEALCSILSKRGHCVKLLTTPPKGVEFCRCNIRVPGNFNYLDYKEEDFFYILNRMKLDYIIVFLGPNNDEYNSKFVDFCTKYLNNNPTTKIIGLTTDHRFLTVNYNIGLNKVYANVIWGSSIINLDTVIKEKVDIIPCNFVYQAHRENFNRDVEVHLKNYCSTNKIIDNIHLIPANQVAKTLSNSRLGLILSEVNINSHLNYCLYGSWPDLDSNSIAQTMLLPENLKLIHTQQDYLSYLEFLCSYKYLHLFVNSLDKQYYDEILDYSNNFVPAKYYELEDVASIAKNKVIIHGSQGLSSENPKNLKYAVSIVDIVESSS